MSSTQVFTDPSVVGPDMYFGLAQTGVKSYYATPSSVPGGTLSTDWNITEWNTDQTMNPAVYTAGGAGTYNQLLGIADWTWATANGDISMSVYGSPGNYVYALSDYGGQSNSETGTGGTDNFLQTLHAPSTTVSFNHPVTFSVDERVQKAVGVDNGEQAMNGFSVAFNNYGTSNYDPSLPTYSVFVQFQISDDRGAPQAINVFSATSSSLVVLPVANWLPFGSDNGNLSAVTIDLSGGVAEMAAMMQHWVGVTDSGFPSSVAPYLTDLSRWSLVSSYIGPETIPGGGMTLDVAHPEISVDTSASYTPGNQPLVAIAQGVVPYVGNTGFYGDKADGTVVLTLGGSTQTVSAAGGTVDFDGGKVFYDPTGYGSVINMLYEGMLGREADSSGLAAKVANVQSGAVTLEQTAMDFLNSDEYKDGYAKLSNLAFLQQAYQNLLGRAADTNGLNSWAQALADGESRAEVVYGMAASPEELFAHGTTPAIETVSIYETVLGRAPDLGPGSGGWNSAYNLLMGQAPEDMIKSFIASNEYIGDGWGANDASFLTHLYENAMGRAPDAAGFNTYMADLANGASRSSIALVFAMSSEAMDRWGASSHIYSVFLPS